MMNGNIMEMKNESKTIIALFCWAFTLGTQLILKWNKGVVVCAVMFKNEVILFTK